MAIIDNTLAASVPTFDPANSLMQVAQMQNAQTLQRQNEFKQAQAEIGSEARGLVPFVNTPEFPAKWAETADRMAQKGLINPQQHQQWRNAPSPLLLKQMIAQTEDPTLTFRKEEAGREQKNQDRSYGLQLRAANRADDETPDGFKKMPDGTYAPLPGGPQDPNYLARVSSAEAKKSIPAGFEPAPEGGLRPIAGGPADPAYKRTVTDKQNAPAGYKWADPNNPDAGLVPIPGGPGEKVPAEVAARLGLAKSFIGQLEDYKDVEGKDQKGLRARIKAGEATGIFDGPMAAANLGEPGSIRRKIGSGAEALLRNLTGAGMNIDEAKKYVARYEPQWNDSAGTLLDKVNQLERELRAVDDTVSKGRGGSVLGVKDKESIGKSGDAILKQARDAIAKGADKAKVSERLLQNGIDPGSL